MNRLLKFNDLVMISNGFVSGTPTYFWAKVISIVDKNNKEHQEMEIITQEGDKNSNVKIKLKKIGKSNGHYWDPPTNEDKFIENVNPEIIISDTHDIHYPSIQRVINAIDGMKKNLDWIKLHQNREFKLKELGIDG